ncbi:MAG: NAD(P)-dependent oxidoreductase [Pseudomonadota bacterium]
MTEPSPPAAVPAHVAFLGLGVMGAPMARHLLAAGHSVCAFNRTAARAEQWLATLPEALANRATLAPTPQAAASGAAVVCLCVGNDDDVRAVVGAGTAGDDGALAGMAPGTVLIDHTTASASVAREVAERAAALGIAFVDAPVSGGQAGAEAGALTIMCGASEADFASVEGFLAAYGARVRRMGPVGAGQLTKMVNQICIAGLLQGLAEGVAFAERAQLDVDAVFEVISAGAAQSWQLDNRAGTMHARQFDFGFAVDWMRKDLAIALAEAQRNGARLPVTALVDQFYADVQVLGGGRQDTSSLVRRLDQR